MHRSSDEGWKALADKALRQRWHERCERSHSLHLDELEEQKKREEEERLHFAKLQEAAAKERAQRNQEVAVIEEHYYNTMTNDTSKDHCSTSPLFLEDVVTPISEPDSHCLCRSKVCEAHCEQQLDSARKERDQALSLARCYRDIAEARQAEKRLQKTELEGKVELVRDFWRNKLVEGSSRSGQILRAALIRRE